MQENDLVERQAVIDDIDEWIDIYGENKCVDAQDILKQVKRSIKKLPATEPTPCDVCRYNPPSSTDGNPCTICPAERRTDGNTT